ncbi:MAG: Asp-tRNA(Asn)/Glu-tRNA(Gln) amidotransferase subunit GatA [Deltaproteobacteria bacterium]|nr:Asp-tRNA(Asn)/Glu-tRNA(Gln) amidotransferase subunit GatA [Deltaproteobacteria bacterium]
MATPPDPTPDTIVAARAALASGALTAEALVAGCLDRIARLDGTLGAFLATDPEGALATARDVDRRRAAGEPLGPLAGIPIAVKDQICTRGLATTAGSKILAGWVPPYDATAVARLRAADAVIIGKTNQDEFAMGSSNESSAFRPAKNPWALDRVPGGSSGGSAAAVAAGLALGALGTDTGGSVRQPASFCGLVGIKPTYGRVSRYGAIAYASSFDQIGPIARTAEDAALILAVIAGQDPLDATSLPTPAPLLPLGASLGGLRVGVPAEYLGDGVSPAVQAAVRQALAVFEDDGATVVPVSLPHTRYAIAVYYLLATAEASSNLARYDGLRYGHRTATPVGDIAELYARTRAEGFGPEVRRRIVLGTFALSAGYYDAYYERAQRVRTLIRRDFDRAFADVDVIATPTSPYVAFALGEKVADPLAMYLADVFTVPASLAGVAALSTPCGFEGGLPIGLQLIGPPLSEPRLLAAADAYQRLTDHHLRRPAPTPEAA